LEVGLKAGSLYPILMRLSDRGLLDAEWEADAPAGRPPRHLYRLNGAGLEYAAQWSSAAPAPIRSASARRRPQPGLGRA
jgi:DNA-binding PadR family transcriptional regulator